MSEEKSNGISFIGTLDDLKDKIISQTDVINGQTSIEGEEIKVFDLDKEEGSLTFCLIGDGTAYETVLRFEGDSTSIPDEVISSIAEGGVEDEDEIESIIWDEWLEENIGDGDSIDSDYLHYQSSIFSYGEYEQSEQAYSVKESLADEVNGWEIIGYGKACIQISLSISKSLKDDQKLDFSKLEINNIEHLGPFGDGNCEYKYSISPKAMENIKARAYKATD